MKRVAVLAVLACTIPAGAGAAELTASPPVPSAAVPPVAALPSAADHETPAPAPARRKAAKPPTLRLGEKRLNDQPGRAGVGEVPAGKGAAKVKGNRLTALVTGAAGSHTLLSCHGSVFVSKVQFVQEFDVVPGAGGPPWVLLSMAAELDGYLRSENQGVATLRRADAVVTPVGGGPGLTVAFPVAYTRPTDHTSGANVLRCRSEVKAPTLVAPAGRYVLAVTLLLETNAEGYVRGHAEAVFAPGARTTSWRSHGDEEAPDVEEAEDFGLTVTVGADAPR